MKNLIMSVSSGLSYSALLPFIHTAKKYVPGADIVLFTCATPSKVLGQLAAEGVRTVPFSYFSVGMRAPFCLLWPCVKLIGKAQGDLRERVRMAKPFCNLFFLRNILFHEFLQENARLYSGILLSDCRDVVFQCDPFIDVPSEPSVIAFLEHPSRTIGECQANASMVRACLGEEGLAKVQGQVPSCAGTVLGNSEGILAYLEAFTSMVPELRRMRMIPGDDQGLHNFLVHTNGIPNLDLRANTKGPVATLGIVPDNALRFDPSGFLLNKSGARYAVLHQYDRREKLRRKFQGTE